MFKQFIRSAGFAFSGIREGFACRNFRIQSCAAVIVVAAGFWYRISGAEWAVVLLCIGMVLSAELFNSAIEVLTDRAFDGAWHKEAGRIKDLAAGAVLMLAIIAAIVACVIFLPKTGLF
ncbi:MAG: diacylglycerol kinase family protein [Mucilaginibacter polytrichastri]|nr:diacylglycerol kinase family protein [Mucilaginibacter polytrichastri]